MKNKLVLLLGSPRSGTTWLAKLFDSHENVLYRHEPDIYLRGHPIPFLPDPEETCQFKNQAADYLQQLLNIRSVKSAGSLPNFPKCYRSQLSDLMRNGMIRTAKFVELVLGKIGVSFNFQIPDLITGTISTQPVYVVKSVSSLGRTLLFSHAAPETKIIHIIRHPCAVVASRLRGKKLNLMADDAFLDTQAKMPQAAKHGLSLEKLKSLTHEQQLATFWMLQNEKVMEEMTDNPNYKVVVYEKLCNEPEKVCRELYDFAGLAWSQQTSDFIELANQKEVGGERYYQIVRNPRQSADKWRKELSVQQINDIEQAVSDSLPGRLYWDA